MAAVCYTIGNNYVSSSNQYFSCGDSSTTGAQAQSCCFGEDYCMEDGICRYTRAGVTNGTGYYMAGCTDPTWKDPACPKQCTSEYTGDIIYNRAEDYWNCCHSEEGDLNCQEPSDFVVKAPGPPDLSTIVQVSTPVPSSTVTSGIGSITSSSAASTIRTAKPTKHPTKHPAKSSPTSTSSSSSVAGSGSIPTGAKAGIAVGVIVGGLLAIGAAFFLYRRSKTRHSKFAQFPDENDSMYSRRNTIHSTIAPTIDTRRNTYASSALPSAYNTNRNTMASSHYSGVSGLPSPGLPSEPPPPLPTGADGMQVVKQLPLTPDDLAQSQEKFAYVSVDPAERGGDSVGPFEVEGDEYKMQQRPKSAQELVGTVVEVAELDGEGKRKSMLSRGQDEAEEEGPEEGMIDVGIIEDDLRSGHGDAHTVGSARSSWRLSVLPTGLARRSLHPSRPMSLAVMHAEQDDDDESTTEPQRPTSAPPESGLTIEPRPSMQNESLSAVESEAPSSVHDEGNNEDESQAYESEGHASTQNLRRADSTTLGPNR